MYKILKYTAFLIILLLASVSVFAQAPQGIPYQAVARNSSGAILASTTIRVRFTIHDSIATGAIVYRETFNPTTSAQGLFNLNLGTGTVVSGTFSSINWGTNAKFMQVEMDPAGGASYIDMGTQQMMSVPYSLYANKSGVPGAVDLPVVATGPITSLSYTSAVSSDTTKANGGEFILFRGICIDTIPLPVINSCVVAPGNTLGAYTTSLSSLIPGKRYRVRAFATNKNGTAYGDTVSFLTTALSVPTLTTDTITGITNNGASGGGTISSDGGSPVTARGLCYSTTINPTIANSLSPSGSGSGSFSTTLSGLTSSVTYYVRAYATNAVGTAYGAQRSFTTILLSVPTITTDTINAITCTGANSGLNCSNSGGSTINSQGVCYGTSALPTIAGLKVTTGTGVGHFSASISGLTPGTLYYARAYSTNTSGTAYGTQFTFTTLPLAVATLTTNSIIGISTTTATSGGNITNDGCSSITARGICWSKYATPTKDSSHTTDGTGTGIYNSNMTGLTPGTTYYVRSYGTNTTGTGYGSTISFQTDSVLSSIIGLPVVGTSLPTTSGSSNISGGYVTISNGASVTARGVCYGTSPSPSISSTHTTDGSGLGYFVSTLALPGCGNAYYLRAYATSSYGTSYGIEYSLLSGFLPTLIDSTIRNITGSSATCGGNVVGDGGCAVTQKGICWGISANPTTTTGPTNWKTTNGAGTGAFTANITGLYNNYTYHLRTYAINGSGTVYGPDQAFTTNTSGGFALGQSYGGGIIFYIDSTGSHGLICSPSELPVASWGCSGVLIGNDSTGIGFGQMNTAAILANCTTTGIAAKLCDDLVSGGYSDWYLPSKDELYLIYTNLKVMGLGGLMNIGYWSSSEVTNTFAWRINMTDGTYSPEWKYYYPMNVRAIRSF